MAKFKIDLLWHLGREEASILQHNNSYGKESCSQLLFLNHAYSGHTPFTGQTSGMLHPLESVPAEQGYSPSGQKIGHELWQIAVGSFD